MLNHPLWRQCSETGCYWEALPDWSIFSDISGMCDVDGIANRFDKFLILEWKGPGRSVARGQSLVLERLARIKNAQGDQIFTILIIHGTTNPMNPEFIRTPGGRTERTSLIDLRTRIADWWAWAEATAPAASRRT